MSLLMTCLILASYPQHSEAADAPATPAPAGTREFVVKGVVKKVEPENGRVIIAHETIPGFMDAMTMPFKVKVPKELAGLRAGDQTDFTRIQQRGNQTIYYCGPVGTHDSMTDVLLERAREVVLGLKTALASHVCDVSVKNRVGNGTAREAFKGISADHGSPPGRLETANGSVLGRELRKNIRANHGGLRFVGQIVLDDVIEQQQRHAAVPGGRLGLRHVHEADIRQPLKSRRRSIHRWIGKLNDRDERHEKYHSQTEF